MYNLLDESITTAVLIKIIDREESVEKEVSLLFVFEFFRIGKRENMIYYSLIIRYTVIDYDWVILYEKNC